jgi:uncharacterized protein (DUF2141 family)
MTIHHARLAMAAASLIAAGTMSVAAQQQAPAGLMARAGATISKAAVAKVKSDSLTMIQGNALNSTNGSLTDAIVRLRDARFGRIVGTQITDKSGLFEFKAVDPGTYIVEVITAQDQTVLAASQLLNINAGEAVSAVVKLPFRVPPFAGILGSTSMPSATAVASQAAASSITAMVPTAPVSPTQ